jgi:hypothetical protein
MAGLYEVCILEVDEVLVTSQTETVPFVPRVGDIISEGQLRFTVIEVRIKYLEKGMRFSVYTKNTTVKFE